MWCCLFLFYIYLLIFIYFLILFLPAIRAASAPIPYLFICLYLISTYIDTKCCFKYLVVFGQFRLPEENDRLQKFFSIFYCTVNLGGFMGMIVTPALRRCAMCFGDDTCYALGFGFPALLVFISIGISCVP